MIKITDLSNNQIQTIQKEPEQTIFTTIGYKTLDNSLLQKYGVKLYGSDRDTYDIINDFLEDNQSERAFYIIDLGALTSLYANWIRLLPNVHPYYAVKCNPNPVIL